jgi:hypothetical protein
VGLQVYFHPSSSVWACAHVQPAARLDGGLACYNTCRCCLLSPLQCRDWPARGSVSRSLQYRAWYGHALSRLLVKVSCWAKSGAKHAGISQDRHTWVVKSSERALAVLGRDAAYSAQRQQQLHANSMTEDAGTHGCAWRVHQLQSFCSWVPAAYVCCL